MNPAQKTLHVTGLWRDKKLEQYEENAKRAWRSHHRLAVRRGTFTGQLNVNERLAAAALDEVRPEAERVFSETARGRGGARRTRRHPRGHAPPPSASKTSLSNSSPVPPGVRQIGRSISGWCGNR